MVPIARWRQLFPPHILRRGEAYYWEGAVEALSRQGDTVRAIVRGTQHYAVELALCQDQIAGWSCDCPYGEDGTPCKHLAAVFLALEEGETPEEPAPPPAPLAQLVERLTPAQARALLLRLGEMDETAADWIRLAAAPQDGHSLRYWERRIDRLLRQAAGRHGFIGYDDAWDVMCRLDNLVTQAAGILLEAGKAWEAFSLTRYSLLAAAGCEMDDSDGGLSVLGGACCRLWQEQIQAAPEPLQRRIHRQLAEDCENPQLALYHPMILDALLASFHAPDLLERSLELLDRLIRAEQAKRRPVPYSLARLVAARLDVMEELGAPRQSVERLEQMYRHLPEIRQRMIGRLLAAGERRQAEALLEESKLLDKGWPGLTAQYSRQLIALYAEDGRAEALCRELRDYVLHCPQQSLEYVSMLKAHIPAEQWPQLLEELLASPSMAYQREELLAQEGQYERLLQVAADSGRLQNLDRWAGVLTSRFPEQIRDAYASCMDRAMGLSHSRQQYAAVIAYLRRLEGCPGGPEAARALAEGWRKAYPRRRSMLEELDRAGYGGASR